MTMMTRRRYLGMDAHKATINVSVFGEAGGPEDQVAIPNDLTAITKLVRRLSGRGVQLLAAYEAGPTGYALHRQLTALGVDCIVVAPSLIPRRAGDRVKTDRRDSEKLGRLLRSGDLTSVWVPDEEHEALRNLVRARADAQVDLIRAKHRLTKFLLRQGVAAPPKVRAWSLKWNTWLDAVAFRHRPDQFVFEDYRATVRSAEQRVRRLESELREVARDERHAPLLTALQALRGIAFLSAVSIVAEVGDPRRFPTARQFMSYVGVVPSEHSSGVGRHRGQITKTGNALLRHVLGEAAHHAWRPPRLTRRLQERQEGVPVDIVEAAWRAQHRLHQRYRHLSGRIGRQKALTAVSRELAGFVWGISQLVEVPEAA